MILTTLLATYAMLSGSRHSADDRFALLVASDPCPNETMAGGKALNGTENDVKCMKQLLLTVWGFDSHNIVILSGDNANRDKILKELGNLALKVGPNCYGLFYYSGHGVRWNVPAPHEDKHWPQNATDRQHALFGIVAHDLKPVWNREINARLIEARGDITEVADTCYAGGLSKGTSPHDDGLTHVKSLDSSAVAVKTVTPTIGPDEAEQVAIKRDDRRALFAAAGQFVPAYEVTLTRAGLHDFQVGCFTAALYRVICAWRRDRPMLRKYVENELSCGGYESSPLLIDKPIGDMDRYFIAPTVGTPRDISVNSGSILRGILADALIDGHIFASGRQVAISGADWLSSQVHTRAGRVTLKGSTLVVPARTSGTRDGSVVSPPEGRHQDGNGDGEAQASSDHIFVSLSGNKYAAQKIDSFGVHDYPAHNTKKEAEDDIRRVGLRDTFLRQFDELKTDPHRDPRDAVQINVSETNPTVGMPYHVQVSIGDTDPENFLFLAFEPSGIVRVVSDAAAYRLRYVQFLAGKPTGMTFLRLLRVDHSITVPADFMMNYHDNPNDRVLREEKYQAFLDWIGKEIAVSTDTSFSGQTVLIRP